MRFHVRDIPGLLIAAAAPAAMMVLVLAIYDIWDHHGTPLLGALAAHIAIGAGLLAAFSRFIRNWDLVVALFGAMALAIFLVILLQQIGHEELSLVTPLKWVAVIAFLLLNVVIPLEYINNGLIPVLNRRDARRAAESES